MPLPSPWPRRWTLLALVIGGVFRLRAYAAVRPLWLDEAMLSLSIAGRTFKELLQPLAMDQSAPVLFLWAERLVTRLAGVNELALRALPLLAGLAVLIVTWRLAARLLTPVAVPVAVAIAALSPALLYYSNEVKPYGLDALWCSLVVLAALALLEAEPAPAAWSRFWLVGTLAIPASTPAFLVLAGVIPALLMAPPRVAVPHWRRRVMLTGVAWALLFVAVYLAVYRAAAQNTYLQTYWNGYFLDPLSPGLGGRLLDTLGATLRDFFIGEGGGWRTAVAMMLLVPAGIGVARLGRTRGWVVAALLVLPILAAFGASAVHRYPVAPRLMLYSAPLWIVLVVAGFEELGERLPGRHVPWFLTAAAAAVLLLPLRNAVAEMRSPSRPQDIRPLVERFRQQHAAGDAVYVFGRAIPAWLFYTTDWRAPDLPRVERLGGLVSSSGVAFRNRATRSGAVRDEGRDLVFAYDDWSELVGVPTGQGPTTTGWSSELPDSGWAENEAVRIRAIGRPQVWVVLSSYRAAIPVLLPPAVQAQGGTLRDRAETTQCLLLRFQFPSSAPLP
ncbi:MAG: glycosyltransferase family 39 protein [Gemmatimonadales bacterium]